MNWRLVVQRIGVTSMILGAGLIVIDFALQFDPFKTGMACLFFGLMGVAVSVMLDR